MGRKIAKVSLLILLAMIVSFASFMAGQALGPKQISFGDKYVLTIGMAGVAYAAVPDYICDGVNDQAEFQDALDSLPPTGAPSVTGGELFVLAGNYSFAATVTRAIDNVTISGVGTGVNIVTIGAVAPFTCTGQTGWVFKNFSCDETPSYDKTNGVSSSTVVEGIWIDGTYTVDIPSPERITRSATLTVAANNATALEKAQADYVCDGTADDVQINAAFTAIASGGTVSLSTGQFNIAAPVYMDSYQILEGQGRGATTLKLTASADCNVIQTLATDVARYFLTVRDLTIDGNKDNTTAGNGITFYRTWYSVLRDLDILNMSEKGIAYVKPAATGANNAHLSNIEVRTCEGTGINFGLGACTDSYIEDARVYSCGMVSGYNVYIGSSHVVIVNLNASVTPAGIAPATDVNVYIDGSSFGCWLIDCVIEDSKSAATGIYAAAANAWHYNVQIIGGYIYNNKWNEYAGSKYGIRVLHGSGKYISDTLIQGVRIQGYKHAISVEGNNALRTKIFDNTFQNQTTSPISDTGTDTKIERNTGYIAPGEVRTYAVTITAGLEDNTTYWQNPFAQNVWVSEVKFNLTTVSSATNPTYDIKLDTDGAGVPDGTAFIDAAPDTVGTYWSYSNAYGGDASGVQTAFIQLTANTGASDWIGFCIEDAAGADCAGVMFITITGQ